jgi:trimeric autotransporter adhesin
MKPLIQLKNLSIVALSLALFTVPLAPKAFGVVPAPDGGYPGGNTAEGQNALFSLTTGGFNTGVGFFALRANTSGQFNTAVGAGTLLANTADRNTAIGAGALLTNSGGHDNTATGAFALLNNTTGFENTAHGGGALFHNVGGSDNTAIGVNALFANMNNNGNTAVGDAALGNNISDGNTAIGLNALFVNTTGHFNTAVGTTALFANSAGSDNTALGAGAGGSVTGASNISVGQGVSGVAGENNTIRIGDNLPSGMGQSACYIGGIYQQGFNNMNVLQVGIDSTGKIGTLASSRRFKRNIRAMDKASETLLALKPVTFRYKKEIDPAGKAQFGLVAEDVEKVNPDLVVCDKEGKPYTVRYDQVNAMLLNEFLKEHKKVQEQQASIADLESTVLRQEKQIAILASGLKKISAQVGITKPPPVMASNR